MAPATRLIVFAHARSGSNSLVEILQLHRQLTVLNEPFNENFMQWGTGNADYRSRITDPASLDAILDEIFDTYQGIKVLTYQLEEEHIEHLAHAPGVHILFLRRRNLLQAAVSNLIALQTNLWKSWDATRPIEDYYGELTPIPIEDVRDLVNWLRSHLDRVQGILDRATAPVMKVVYEDVFLAPVALQGEWLRALWSFLDLTPFDDARVRHFLDPREVQQGTTATYGRLPNLVEIEAACGSDDSGRLGDVWSATSPRSWR